MSFADRDHDFASFVYHGAVELRPEEVCDDVLLTALRQWRARQDTHSSGIEAFHLDRCLCFAISYQGESSHHWPNEEKTFIIESLVRQFLFHEGLCTLQDTRVHLYHMRYTVLAIDDHEYLLVCPYITPAGNIGGLTVVCVNQCLREGAH